MSFRTETSSTSGSMSDIRRIIHVDMDEFFAAVEKLDNPELRGRPLLIGGSPRSRGVVSTASYEARAFGCHSAMPMATAIRLCPQAVVLPVRGSRYSQVSDQVFEIFERFTPLVEPLSCDEAFLDVTGSVRLFGGGEKIGRRIKQTIRDELGLVASVGVAPNKFLAKLASDLDKPDGFVVLRPQTYQSVIDSLPLTKLWGVGPSTLKTFERYNLKTIGQLRMLSQKDVAEWFGDGGEFFWRLANGLDDRPVVPDHQAKSIGQEQTFASDVADVVELRRVLNDHVERITRRLRRHELLAKTITLKLRYGDFVTVTRSVSLKVPADTTDDFLKLANDIFDRWCDDGFKPLRLIGATLSNLRHRQGRQMSLFGEAEEQKKRRLDSVIDDIADKFGSDVLRRGGNILKNHRDESDE
ncbi:MAG TPA: DNA polymerase IV [Phycisphaerae bacterium]|nr:DNA polymerase IV [Phycisphaerae bacterium]